MFTAVEDGFDEHPKTLAFCEALADQNAGMYLVRVWRWAMKYAKDGDLARYWGPAVERAARWQGASGTLLAALLASGYVDPDFKLHDWMDHNGKWVAKAEQSKARMAALRLLGSEPPANGSRTVRAQTQNVRISDMERRGEERLSDLLRSPPIRSVPDPEPAKPEVQLRRVDFDAAWVEWPKKVGKGSAEKAFHRAKARGLPDTPALVAIIRDRITWDDYARGFVQNFATWLNADGWNDERPAARARAGPMTRTEANMAALEAVTGWRPE